MPLSLSFLPSFERSLKSFDAGQEETVRLLLKAIMIYYASPSMKLVGKEKSAL
jgi:hypothetical protein